MERRQFLAAAFAAPFAMRAAARSGYRAVLTSDFAVPHGDPDDYYDVASAVSLGFHGVVLDGAASSPAASRALRQVGARELDPADLRNADAVVVVGASTNAARHYRRGQRVVLFAGDAAGLPEVNVTMDPDAYAFLRRRGALWVPCFDGGTFVGSPRSSWTLTEDDAVIGGTRFESWFRSYCGDVYGARSLYCGAYLGFASRDVVAGATAAPFVDAGQLAAATRALLLR